jgi:hypothetical protein
LTNPRDRNIITLIRGSERWVADIKSESRAAFISESMATFLLECAAGFVGFAAERKRTDHVRHWAC